MRDRASANGVAMRTIQIIYSKMLDVGCYSHMIDLVGEKFCTPHLDSFVRLWVSLFSHSPRARLLWRNQTGKAVISYSPTRWWSKWEVIFSLMASFGDVAPVLESNPKVSPTTNQKLLKMLHNPSTKSFIQVELAAVVDAGEAFVKATYTLEGDGPLVLKCFEVLSTLAAGIQEGHYPNVQAIIETLGTNSTQIQWCDYAKSCINPGLQYFLQKCSQELKESVAAFKAARYFLPQKVVELKPDAETVDTLHAFPFITPVLLANLKLELSHYIAQTADIDADFDPLEWWKTHQTDLPY